MPSDKYNVMLPGKGGAPEKKPSSREACRLFAERTQPGQGTPTSTSSPYSPGKACPPRALPGLPLNSPGGRAGGIARAKGTGSGPLRAGGGQCAFPPESVEDQRRQDAYRKAIADAMRSDPGVLLRGEIRFPEEVSNAAR